MGRGNVQAFCSLPDRLLASVSWRALAMISSPRKSRAACRRTRNRSSLAPSSAVGLTCCFACSGSSGLRRASAEGRLRACWPTDEESREDVLRGRGENQSLARWLEDSCWRGCTEKEGCVNLSKAQSALTAHGDSSGSAVPSAQTIAMTPTPPPVGRSRERMRPLCNVVCAPRAPAR